MAAQSPPAAAISQRVGAISESATIAMERRARELSAGGQRVISLAAGEPDLPTSEAVVEAAAAACREPRLHHYTPVAGLPELREAVAQKTSRDSGQGVAAANVLITSGTKQAIDHAFAALLDPGDEVLLASPYWVTHPEVITITGGVPVAVAADDTRGFRVGVAELEAARTERTKALLFVSPANPSGAVYGEAQMREIGTWAAEHRLWVVSDDIYEHFNYTPSRPRSLPALVPELEPLAISVNGAAKSYAMTGWRVGWMVGPVPVVSAATNLHSHVSGNISNVAQAAALAALRSGLGSVHRMRDLFRVRRDRTVAAVQRLPGFECLTPDGAFYVFPSVVGVLGRSLGGRRIESSLDLAEAILDQAKVALVPGEAFGAPGHLRFSYAASDADLAEGLERIARLLA
ncbi:MAG: pyridoxal phosphate-dependent aminotransferase [Candidatus Dormibacteria bacterium]